MENQTTKDTQIKEIREENVRVRFVGKLVSFDDKTGVFEVEDDGLRLTCLPNYQEQIKLEPSEIVLVTGRSIAADSSFEIRADKVEKININDYNNYKKYLTIRNNLLNGNGS
ncbi:hypothetical protein M1137_00825 [Candidatus Parvarchaeota archaeon]|jgi:hypothetical protein|nr:hypothetical protein [Candidatus Parvarchaeota archaeon]